MLVVGVLDINGVLADVRKISSARVRNKSPDLVLPNGQHVHYRPEMIKLYRHIERQCDTIIIFTSRLRKNAMPIIEDMSRKFGIKIPRLILCGEDCKYRSDNEPWRPVKDTETVLCALENVLSVKPTSVTFIDDNPERIKITSDRPVAVSAIRIPTYDAAATHVELDLQKLCIARK